MSNSSDQFIAFEIKGGADKVEMSENLIAGKMNGVLKSDEKIETLILHNNTILNTDEIEVLTKIIESFNFQEDIPEFIKQEFNESIQELKDNQTPAQKILTFKKIAKIGEKLVHLSASLSTIAPKINQLISQLPL